MTDRELLELAARAAGIEHPGGEHSIHDDGRLWDCKALRWWNPLQSDADALRLAVRLGLKIMPYPIYGADKHSVIVSKRVPATDPESEVAYVGPECVEIYGIHPEEATRRAIVRAAAEIGKGMQP